jgi:chemotaxis signal transduction protein
MARTVRSQDVEVPGDEEPAAGSPVELICLTIGGVTFALPLAVVEAVLESAVMQPGGAEDGWIGVIPTAVGRIPVVEGGRLFGLDPSAAPDKLVVCRGESPWAISVDDIRGSVRVAGTAIQQFPVTCGATDQLLLSGMVTVAEDEIALLMAPGALQRAALGQPDRRRGDRLFSSLSALTHAFAAADYSQVVELLLHDDERAWAVPLACVRHIADYRRPQLLPRTHNAVRGLLTWRDRPIPLVVPEWEHTPAGATGPLVVVGPPAQDQTDDTALAALLVRSVAGIRSAVEQEGPLLRAANQRLLLPLDLPALLATAAGAAPRSS